jgi:hypothetical protein
MYGRIMAPPAIAEQVPESGPSAWFRYKRENQEMLCQPPSRRLMALPSYSAYFPSSMHGLNMHLAADA